MSGKVHFHQRPNHLLKAFFCRLARTTLIEKGILIPTPGDTFMPKPRYKSCNAELLKHLRERRRFTQADLAAAAGYTERLIAKAESGATLSRETIEDIAEALSTPTDPITPDDLTSDPILIAQTYIHGLYVHQKDIVDRIGHIFDENIVAVIHGDPRVIPFAGKYCGIDEVRAGFQVFFSFLEVPAGHDHRPHYQYVSQGTNVVVWGRSWIHPIGAPLCDPMPICNLMKIRQGKLYYFEDQYDTGRTAVLLDVDKLA